MCLCLMNKLHYFDEQHENNSPSRNEVIVVRQQHLSITCFTHIPKHYIETKNRIVCQEYFTQSVHPAQDSMKHSRRNQHEP